MKFFLLILFCCYWWKISYQYYSPQMLNKQKESMCPRLPKGFLSVAGKILQKDEAAGKDKQTDEQYPLPLLSHSSYRHSIFQGSNEHSELLHSQQWVFEEATRKLYKKWPSMTPEHINVLKHLDLDKMLPNNAVANCMNLLNYTCYPNSKYRTFDGSCNNLEHPTWGMASACTQRFLPAWYSDGISKIRLSKSGAKLPSPRFVCQKIHSHIIAPSDEWTNMFMQWGQFMAHDITLSPMQSGHFDCCGKDINNEESCGPILLEKNDTFYSKYGKRCLDNVRTASCTTCKLGPRQQMNQKTSYIDGSHIYGISKKESDGLRNFDGKGTLKSMHGSSGELLPRSSHPDSDGCSFQVPGKYCFEAGDERVNQHPSLTALHTGWLRYHNHIAKRLYSLNPHWDDDRIFEEARRLIIALLQLITHKEYLPTLIGGKKMRYFKLNVQNDYNYTEYDRTANPTTWNEFAGAAYRFGHSFVSTHTFSAPDPHNFRDRLMNNFAWPFKLYSKGSMESIMHGLCVWPQQKFDRHMVSDLRNHLYERRGNDTGLDLCSLNVYRGRDHGIPPYVEMVKFCGGPDIKTFKQLEPLFRKGYRQLFEKVYEDVGDIDFWSGGLAEKPKHGVAIGPTFICITGIQFYHLKYGDRFYFEHKKQAGSFTPGQLHEIKKMTFAKVICAYSKIDALPKNVLLTLSPKNPMKSCKDLPDMDLKHWKERC